MKRLVFAMGILTFVCLTRCGSSGGDAIEKSLALSERESLPTQAEFPDDGAVILSEKYHTEFTFDSNWNIERTHRVQKVILYLNDKAEELLMQKIYLDEDRLLTYFTAKVYKPDGTVLKLSKKDLVPTMIIDNDNTLSKESSVKFTFPGVEPGAVLEYQYIKSVFNQVSTFDVWRIEDIYPKLYSSYSIQVPDIFIQEGVPWNYYAVNCMVDKPKVVPTITSNQSEREKSTIYNWEKRDIAPIESEAFMPLYEDIAQYIILGIPHKKWDDLSERYWEMAGERFSVDDARAKTLAEKIIGDAVTDEAKIDSVFRYTQKEFRYIASHLNDGGLVPRKFNQILTNKFGDCKDMTVLNVVLLRTLGIEAYPALVKTKSDGKFHQKLIYMTMNHMVTYTKTSEDHEYWLDSTGSNCPLGCVYPDIEGRQALVLFEDSKSTFKTIPQSSAKENCMIRKAELTMNGVNALNGQVTLTFTGNENLFIRSALNDASEKDMQKIVKKYMAGHLPNIEISNLKYDNLSCIAEQFSITFDVKQPDYGNYMSNMLMIKPCIFKIDDHLDDLIDDERVYPITNSYCYTIKDSISLSWPKLYQADSEDALFSKRFDFGGLQYSCKKQSDRLLFSRSVNEKAIQINSKKYTEYRELLNAINKSNEYSMLLKQI